MTKHDGRPYELPPREDVSTMTSLRLREVVEAAAEGNADAFESLYRALQPLIRSVIRAEVSNAAVVDDLVQDVFCVAWQKIGSLKDPARLRPWLLQVTRRIVIDHGRRSSRSPQAPNDPSTVSIIDQSPGPELQLEAADLAQRIERAVSALSERDALLLRMAVDGDSLPMNIGEVLHITPVAAKVALHRARSRLRVELQRSA
jgi:RNA polymerase sigma-70 factor, ECF subfamily